MLDDSPPKVAGGASPSQEKVQQTDVGSVTSVKVAVRVRPLIGMESSAGCQACMFGDSDNAQVVAGDNRCFQFDNVFGVDSTQEEVYRRTTLPLVDRCLDGFNATVLAYGQTGSGKTWTVGNAYTVNGAPEDAGIIPRAVVDIFKRVEELRAEGVKASVHASFLEVLNEEIKDLLGGSGVNGEGTSMPAGGGTVGGLALRENLEGEVTVAGLSQHEISGARDLGGLLERGALCRATASTNMNTHSSRSHAICTLSFELVRPPTEDNPETVSNSKFHLVDLAGSERAKKTGAEGKRLREGININKGLLALGNVISALSEGSGRDGAGAGAAGGGSHRVHVPYRDSKLTRLLQGSLGGNSHTVMIACVSPADSNMAESLTTLRYAGRAMNIKNTAVKNEGIAGAPVSYAEVMALRKEVRTLQVELVHARVSSLAGLAFGGARGKASTDDFGDTRDSGDVEAARAAVQEAAELRRGQNALESRVLEATRQATAAVEGEMSARLESDTWRLRCEQLTAVLQQAAPTALAALPSWATGEADSHDEIYPGSSSQFSPGAASEHACVGDQSEDNDGHATKESSMPETAPTAAAGSLARELRKKVFELEAQVSELQGCLVEAREVAAGGGGSDGVDAGGGNGAVTKFASSAGHPEDSFSSVDAGGHNVGGEDFDNIAEGGEEVEETEGVNTEELRQVDHEIKKKERELLDKANQARAYEAMKGQFEGLLGRLQGEVSSLQSERDGLLHKLSVTTKGAQSNSGGRGGVGGSTGAARDGSGGGDGAALSSMRARVASLEARIKDNRKRVAEYQNVKKRHVALERAAERLRSEVAEAKQRRAELQRVHREASTRFQKETRQLHLKEARMRRNGERMQWQVKKLQESQSKTQAALKRKMEEHSIAMRKMRKLESQRVNGARDGGGMGAKNPAVKDAKKAEMTTWLAAEIEEASAVQRAKRALKEQLRLRSEAAQKVHKLREEQEKRCDEGASAADEGDWEGAVESDESRSREAELTAVELAELQERIATGSKVIQNLQAFLISADRNSTATGARLPGGANGAANARWSRLRTPWDNKTALSLLLAEAVRAKVIGMDFAEASSLKDMELRSLSREVAALRATAAGRSVGLRGAREAMAAAVAVAAEAVEAVGEGSEREGSTGESTAEKDSGKNKTEERATGHGEDDSSGEYEEQERSFMLMSDSEDDDEEEEEEDDDEEWLPGANRPNKKRSSNNSATAAAAIPGKGGQGRDSNGRDRCGNSRASGGSSSSSSKDNTHSFESMLGDSDDLSAEEEEVRSSVGIGRSSTEWAKSPDATSGSFSSSSYSVSRPRREVINWANLDLYTVVQLKEFLRHYHLPVSGKKDVLTARLRTALNTPSPERPVESSSASADGLSFSSSASSVVFMGSGGDILETSSSCLETAVPSPPAAGAGGTNISYAEEKPTGAHADSPSLDRNVSETDTKSQPSLRARLQARARDTRAQESLREPKNTSTSTERKDRGVNGDERPFPVDRRTSKSDDKKPAETAETVPARTPLGVLRGRNNVPNASVTGKAHEKLASVGCGLSKSKTDRSLATTIKRVSGGGSRNRTQGVRPSGQVSTSTATSAHTGTRPLHHRRPNPMVDSKSASTETSVRARIAAYGVSGGGGAIKRSRPLGDLTRGNEGVPPGDSAVPKGNSRSRDDPGSLVAKAQQQAKRAKMEGYGGRVLSHLPSYLKPTKSTGAHATGALNSRSSGGSGSGKNDDVVGRQ